MAVAMVRSRSLRRLTPDAGTGNSEPYGRTREGNPEGEGACLVYMTAERGLGRIALPPACFNA